MSRKPQAPGGAGTRVLRTRVKKKSGLKDSSRRWLERHLNDPYSSARRRRAIARAPPTS